ncbi:MAG: hypothetical protein HY886_07155 [Deltaproteobacteria bacterium]|nr:hypothetical protein [Deltaproteobacteria bacterium]
MADELRTNEAGTGRKSNADADASKVVFTPEQQGKVQELIDDAFTRAYAKALRTRGHSDDADRLKKEVDALKHEKKSAALLRSLSRHNVVDAEEVCELLKDKVRLDEDGFKVVNETGGAMINSAGHPMNLDEFVGQWLDDRPHHLRSGASAGAGSTGARSCSNGLRRDVSDPAAWRTMPREELDKRLKDGIVLQGAAGQTYTFRDVKNPFLEARRRRLSQNNAK